MRTPDFAGRSCALGTVRAPCNFVEATGQPGKDCGPQVHVKAKAGPGHSAVRAGAQEAVCLAALVRSSTDMQWARVRPGLAWWL